MSIKQELLDTEDRAWRALCAQIDRLSDDAWLRPGVNGEWTAKDVLAHIAVWHAQTTDRFETLRATGEIPKVPDVDAFNAQQYEECRDLSLHDVRVMSGACRHRFREEVALLTEPLSELAQAMIAANGHEHYDEHIPQLEAFLAGAR